MIEVRQEDRDKAADLFGDPMIRGGKEDEHAVVQAFAAHRQQAEDAMRERCCAAFEAAIDDGYDIAGSKVEKCEHGQFGWEDCIACYDNTLRGKVSAIRGIDAGGKGIDATSPEA